jgi:hypothetical protein
MGEVEAIAEAMTPEMIHAGWQALLAFESRDFPDRAMVIDVIHAALLAAPPGWLECVENQIESLRRQSGTP